MRWGTVCALGGAVGLFGGGGCYQGAHGGASGTDSVGTDAAEDGDGDGDDEGSSGDEDPPPVECDGEVLDPGPNLARRLTVHEYGNTVEALLGVDIRDEAEQELPAELRADGFTNTASGLITTLQHVEGYDTLAELAVQRIPSFSSFVGEYTSCRTFADDCRQEFVRNAGRRAFRRPLTDDEVDLLAEVFDIAETEGEGFDVGAGLVLEAMMQSPPFLYRLEDETTGNEARELDGFELATRLSYLIWAGPPDVALLDVAEADELRSDDEIEGAVDRMLADPRARGASVAFVHDWLHLSRLDNLPRDPERFPGWSAGVAAGMQAETLNFFTSIAWEQDRSLLDLYNAQETWLTPDLAAYYGIASQGEGVYDVSAIPERGGLLTQGSLLTIGGDTSSMVARGLFVFDNILCQHPESPPPGVDTTPPEVTPGQSQRDYSEERTGNPSCAGCHLQFEPFAWGLERYLADGSHSLVDHLGNELREDGALRLPGEDDPLPYENAAEMVELLAGADAVRECLAVKGTQFAIGRPLADNDECSIGKLQERFSDSGQTWRDLVLSIALSPGFRSIRVES